MDKSVETGIGISCCEMKWNDHKWKKTVADEDRVSDTALKEGEKVKQNIDHEAKAVSNH